MTGLLRHPVEPDCNWLTCDYWSYGGNSICTGEKLGVSCVLSVVWSSGIMSASYTDGL